MSDYDIIIAGGGGAGLAAAVTASEANPELRILVLESADETGGAAAMSGGGMCLVGTALQRAHGVEDDVDLAMFDWMAVGGPEADAEWALEYLSRSNADVFEWLESLGMEWTALNRQEMNSVARWHAPAGSGEALAKTLLNRAVAQGVEVRTGTRVRRIVQDDERVSGVVVESASATEEIDARIVIVTTGGFVNSPEKLESLAGRTGVLSGGAPNAGGDGYDLLEEAGATFVGIDRLAVYPIGTPNPRISNRHGVAVRGIVNDLWVNSSGHRFHDERLRGGMSGGPAVIAQPGSTCFAITDARGMAEVRINGDSYYGIGTVSHRERIQELLDTSPFIWTADTIDELAQAAHLPVESVRDAVSHWNEEIAGGNAADSEFGWPIDGREPIDQGPFTCIQYFPIAQKNFGGARTTLSCEIVGRGGGTILGLLAAGEVAGMGGGHINGSGALEGTMLGPSLFSGRVAGRAAARIIEESLSPQGTSAR